MNPLGTEYAFANMRPGVRPHVCNCIGCCKKCGQCRTAPWHVRTCDAIAALNAERERIVADARS